MTESTADMQANLDRIRNRLPDNVAIVAAAKSRSVAEIEAALDAGIHLIGHNYVQEAERMIGTTPRNADWHMIGHLQRNKVKSAVRLFDMIQTVDSLKLARTIDRQCAALGMRMPVLVEINSGIEANKTGVVPEQLDEFLRLIAPLKHLRIQGLMTMGPRFGDPELARPYFRATRAAFDRIAAAGLPNIEMRVLSMGMSNSFEIAVEEGSNMVRIGTELFGSRLDCQMDLRAGDAVHPQETSR